MKKLRQNKEFRYFARTCFNAGVTFAGTQIAGLEGDSVAVIVGLGTPALNFLTKYVNMRFFGDMGVAKK